MNLEPNSIYYGTVSHQRQKPIAHGFKYEVASLYLEVDTIKHIHSKIFGFEKWKLYSFWRKDYHGKASTSLKEAVFGTVNKKTGTHMESSDRVFILTQPRILGFCFNPVSFYYVWDESLNKCKAIMAEINNTPWDERYSYVFLVDQNKSVHQYNFNKEFHVSPFMPMEQAYQWNFNIPNEKIVIDMKNFDKKEGYIFNATMTLKKKAFNDKNLFKLFYTYPLMTLKILCAIYFHALRLKLKGNPYYKHPKYRDESYAS